MLDRIMVTFATCLPSTMTEMSQQMARSRCGVLGMTILVQRQDRFSFGECLRASVFW